MNRISIILLTGLLFAECGRQSGTEVTADDPDTLGYDRNLVDFTAYEKNPVFTGTGKDTWDEKIRERGYILRENGIYHMWYTGFRDKAGEAMHLGYATSPDGLEWTRFEKNPVVDSGWVEDMMVIKHDSTYYMFAEGANDIAHLLVSEDRVKWKEHGALDIRYVNGQPLSEGAYGTPTAWFENGIWYLFYERGDLGIWLATSTDLNVWTNKQDDPVILTGPEPYDKYGVAVNQIVKHNDKYYAYYHATAFEDWHEWTSCVAISDDLVHWKKYKKNPIMRENKSSPILVHDGDVYRLYIMHSEVCVHFPVKDQQ